MARAMLVGVALGTSIVKRYTWKIANVSVPLCLSASWFLSLFVLFRLSLILPAWHTQSHNWCDCQLDFRTEDRRLIIVYRIPSACSVWTLRLAGILFHRPIPTWSLGWRLSEQMAWQRESNSPTASTILQEVRTVCLVFKGHRREPQVNFSRDSRKRRVYLFSDNVLRGICNW